MLYYQYVNIIFTGVDNLLFDIQRLTDTRVVVEIKDKNGSKGILYFEKPKIGWVNKPIIPSKWACVDAEISELYKDGEYDISPKDIIGRAQELISSF
jgi:hypothetical protein